jgi:hypothetical protein
VVVCIFGIRMPPTFTDKGLRAAGEIHRRWPTVGLLEAVLVQQHG